MLYYKVLYCLLILGYTVSGSFLDYIKFATDADGRPMGCEGMNGTRWVNNRDRHSDITRYTICPRSSAPFYIEGNYIQWVNTSWTYTMLGQLDYDD